MNQVRIREYSIKQEAIKGKKMKKQLWGKTNKQYKQTKKTSVQTCQENVSKIKHLIITAIVKGETVYYQFQDMFLRKLIRFKNMGF